MTRQLSEVRRLSGWERSPHRTTIAVVVVVGGLLMRRNRNGRRPVIATSIFPEYSWCSTLTHYTQRRRLLHSYCCRHRRRRRTSLPAGGKGFRSIPRHIMKHHGGLSRAHDDDDQTTTAIIITTTSPRTPPLQLNKTFRCHRRHRHERNVSLSCTDKTHSEYGAATADLIKSSSLSFSTFNRLILS